jgi:hypothetical protein
MYRLNQGVTRSVDCSLPSPQAAPLWVLTPEFDSLSLVTSELGERVGRTFVHHNLPGKSHLNASTDDCLYRFSLETVAQYEHEDLIGVHR